MKMKLFRKGSRLAFLGALQASLPVGTVGAVLFWLFQTDLAETLLLGFLLSLITFVSVYGIIYRMHRKRLKILNRVLRNIACKRFEDYDKIANANATELDSLIKQSISASQTVEREIQRLNRIENYRKEFIGDISHELKTPIFAVQGFIETLLNGAIDDENVNRRFLNKAMRNVNRLTYLTKDLMEISKLETGELKSEIKELYLADVIIDAVESLQYKAKNEGVTVSVEAIDKNIRVRADRNQIKQVLINLIENSIKYNQQGGRVGVGAETYSKDDQRMLVYVQDTGIGIEQQYVERITERFFRIDKSRSREKGGTGLGLAIVKHIMEAHGEELFIESMPNEGSTFSFTLTKI